MNRIDGRVMAAAIRADVASDVMALREAGTVPTLAIVVPTRDEAAAWYVRSLVRAAGQVGIDTRRVDLDEPTGAQLAAHLDTLSGDPAVHGVICQTPLPDGLPQARIAEHITPAKDVDGASPACLGRLAAGLPAFTPATARAVLEILLRLGTPLAGAEVVVVGRSTVIGKPAALLLLAEHATVTVCHSRTRDLAAHTRRADVLVAAAGQARLLGADHVRPGAVVIDVGTNSTEDGGLVGDVDEAAVASLAGALTPVPGGVGPVTTACLLRNVVMAARSPAGVALPPMRPV